MRSLRVNTRLCRAVCVLALVAAAPALACSGDDRLEDVDLAYVSANPPEPRFVSIQGASIDQQDRPLAEALRPDHYNIRPHFSPDGTRVAYERRVFDMGENVGRLFTVDLGETQPEQVELTDLGHDEHCQLWPRGFDPEGRTVAFVCVPVEQDATRRVGIAVLDGQTELFEPADGYDTYTDARFGPDGDLVVAARNDEGRALLRVDPDDPDQIDPVISFEDHRIVDEIRIAPDGATAALVRATEATEPATRPDAQVLVVDLEDGDVDPVLTGDDEPTAADHHSVQGWHPDGDRLLVATGGFGHGPGQLRLVDTDDPDAQTTLAAPEDLDYSTIRRADVSPDGTTIVFSANDSDEDEPMRWNYGHLYLVDADGSDLQRLDELSVPDQVNQPTFNPDL